VPGQGIVVITYTPSYVDARAFTCPYTGPPPSLLIHHKVTSN
jgi:hypothetical protein